MVNILNPYFKLISRLALVGLPTIFIFQGLSEDLYGHTVTRETGEIGLAEFAITVLIVVNLCISYLIALFLFFIPNIILNIIVIKLFPNKLSTRWQEWQKKLGNSEKSEKVLWRIFGLLLIVCYFTLLPSLATKTLKIVHGYSPELESRSVPKSELGSRNKVYDKKKGELEFLEGIKFYEGTGVEKNMDEAFKLFKKAVENRHKGAQFYLGLMYFNGLGTEQNYDEALRWFKLSATNKSAAAQNNVGLMYHYGYGVEVNTIEALNWYTKAAREGSDTAYSNLGIIYFEGGEGVNKNYIKSFIWSTMAQKSGLDRSDFLIHLRKNMPDWHAEKAVVLAEKCWKHKRYINPMQYCEE